MSCKPRIQLKLNCTATFDQLISAEFDDIVVATVTPRQLDIPGIDHPKVLSYLQVLRERKPVGQRVAIIGAGVLALIQPSCLVMGPKVVVSIREKFYDEWGIDTNYENVGGLKTANVEQPEREIYLLQRKAVSVGSSLGKTTGWIHRAGLKHRNVKMIAGASYEKLMIRACTL